MASLSSIIFYILSFLALYVQVFFLVTFFENRKKIISRTGKVKLKNYKPVTIIVPCWNEETTIDKTVKSILDLNYPKDKLHVFLIDDGSSDSTWEVLQKYQNIPNFKIFKKENGGKHTALNFGLGKLETDYIGCLDADSVAHPDAVNRIMSYFENDNTLMAVAPSIIVVNDKKIIQNAQSAEYYMAVYIKKMLGFLGGIHVTPGPLTIFKKKVFDDLGPYRHAHNTEDMEIAYRMQINGYKIEQCNDAFVYTNTPNTVYKLYKQRLRWIYGFINNTIDYKKFLFKSKYGNFSLFTVPAGIISIFAASYLFFRFIYNISQLIYNKFIEYQAVGLDLNINKTLTFDPFFISTKAFFFITIVLYALVITSMLLGSRIAKNKWSLSVNMFYFFFIYSVIAPFWLMRAVYNTLISKKPSWR
ncbi:MAG: glycosyltransferase family 2 protein [Candidatus Pacebacteria bacterium]|nr:glycosyltransferase family 2 protein [Candidatus Paceibacterota bacterium]